MISNDDARALVHSYQEGNEQALDTLYEAYKGPLYRFFYRYTGDEQLSIDLVQDTFMRLDRYKNRYNSGKSSFKTYLFKIGYNLMMTKLKRRSRLQRLLPFLAEEEPSRSLVDDRLDVREAVRKLPEEQRVVILLSYYHDMPQKDIANVLKIPVGTVKSRLYRAIQTLRQALEVGDDE